MIDLDRFKQAQFYSYKSALKEIRAGRKQTHWMWFVFPQIIGLGESETSVFYSIKSKEEAESYLKDELLGKRLLEISNALLKLDEVKPEKIFGGIDSIKLKSSMTLFELVDNDEETFKKVLDKYFDGERDQETIRIWNSFKNNKTFYK